MAKNRPIDLSNLECCPKCESSWVDKPIPEQYQEHHGGSKWYSRVIGLYDRDQDRTVAWQCPDCGTCWDRDTGMIRPSIAWAR
jgi:hypothetical protein